ncbi:hypothetical protein D9757_013079 [Collybiopsis confluens]|uniref:Cytochrome P450 n=1 Tax=Collybiopsis confluens TaxID=2823264 RepID=A0A8H5CYE5_9AGAR|nr:hypothetical protein D9757_013079 [Collybiopsis confluens]
MASLEVTALFALCLLSVFYFARWKSSQARYPFPPGPKKLPIVENLFDIPSKGQIWLDYSEMSRRYGSDIIHLSALGNSIVVLNTAKAVSDLLEKRSLIYSSRPYSTMIGELMGWKNTLFFLPYGEAWKSQRKIFHQAIPPGDMARFHSKLLKGTRNLLRVIARTDDVLNDFQSWVSVFILDVVYGIQEEDAGDFLLLGSEAIESLGVAGTPGAFYVEQIPLLKYVPDWFPGADFKRKANKWNDIRKRITEGTFEATKEQELATATPSIVSVALQRIDASDDVLQREGDIKSASMAAYAGASDTTVVALANLIAALLLNPDVQAIAHRELDKVLGLGKLPDFSDEPSLPYITAIIMESFRHQPLAPLAFPHLVTQDDVYEGYHIPKGSYIIGNTWSIFHNEDEFPDPGRFNPSRFIDRFGKIDPNIRDPTFVFGFGRRICPGKHLALASLFIATASILACYKIEPELDEHGELAEPKVQRDPAPSLINKPLPFKCRFVPRSKEIDAFL